MLYMRVKDKGQEVYIASIVLVVLGIVRDMMGGSNHQELNNNVHYMTWRNI